MYINVDIGVTRASLTWMQARSGACFFVALPRFSFCRSATRCSIGWAGTTASRRASASMSWPVIQLLDLPSMNKHLLQVPVCMGISDFQNSSTGKTKLRSPRVGKVIGYCVPKITEDLGKKPRWHQRFPGQCLDLALQSTKSNTCGHLLIYYDILLFLCSDQKIAWSFKKKLVGIEYLHHLLPMVSA